MAKAAVAVTLLAVALLLTVNFSEARLLHQAGADVSGVGQGQNTFSFGNAAAKSTPVGSYGLAAGAAGGNSVNNGKLASSTSTGNGFSFSLNGKSKSFTNANTISNNNPGAASGITVGVNSANGGASTSSRSTTAGASG